MNDNLTDLKGDLLSLKNKVDNEKTKNTELKNLLNKSESENSSL